MFNFQIKNKGEISERFLELGLENFRDASLYVKNLSYKRNKNKENKFCVLEDLGGTCSTKHALLKHLCDENGVEVYLILGVFKMNGTNTPKISGVLSKHNLLEIPEAHNYLKYNNIVLDFTEKNWNFSKIENDILEEIEISPIQITDFKVKHHQKFLKNYLENHPEIQYSIEEFWMIREECVSALQIN